METTENELTLLVRSLSNLRNLRVLCLQRVLNLYPHRYEKNLSNFILFFLFLLIILVIQHHIC